MVTERESYPEVVLRNAKALRLVHQRQALNSEGLVFVSPQQDGSQKCGDCGKIYSPLIYQVDKEIESHHFCASEGGIYFCRDYRLNVLVFLNWTGWIALLEPSGSLIHDGMMSRSQKVKVKEIRAFCNKIYCKRGLNEGILIDEADNSSLIPLCSTDEHPEHVPNVRYTFRIDDGQVLFSQV